MPYYVYILAKKKRSTLYTGVTNDLVRRTYEHKEGLVKGFTKKHGIKTLVYFEVYDDVSMAIHREKIIKKWKRTFKYDAIEKTNPQWRDLYEDIAGQTPQRVRGDSLGSAA